ncbi:MAG: bifunctional phosphopantothenoylcysteine decarboxylase/phosphopantothenate--cysteine ligase CoaBC [Xanthomonadales bacterium]|nr:bifunctional phosphopantothenoylcysteine decarboxylase/phosphopantothenate--cysteine ligase CoaBC [Xanthomonadales bacterium]
MRLLLGVTGGIAAYKAAELVRLVRQAGAEVRVVMTPAAGEFVGAATFQALSGQPVRSSLWDPDAEAAMGHIELARWATQILVAPASADFLARQAQGLAGDLLGTVLLASAAPVAVAPAMNQQMRAHPATQDNLVTLRRRGVTVLGPASGEQACGDSGPGRLLEPTQLLQALIGLQVGDRLAGLRVLVSAGPTFEDLDPVRFIGNRSSGRMGFAVAEQAALMGAQVTLVAGPTSLPDPPRCQRVNVRSAEQMLRAVLDRVEQCDVYIGAAAVADYRPVAPRPAKIKKSAEAMEIQLVRNPDILSTLAERRDKPFLVGFAAETDDVLHYARGKLQAKRLDMIAANQVGRAGTGFDSEDNQLTLLWPDGELVLPPASKRTLARQLLECVAERLPPGTAA